MFVINTGLSGFYPIHPRTYMQSWRNRALAEAEAVAKEARDKIETQQQQQS